MTENRKAQECGSGFDCQHGRHYQTRADAENCPHGDYSGPALDAPIAHRTATRIVAECRTCLRECEHEEEFLYRGMVTENADRHRAAGHDVRPVRSENLQK